MMPLSEYKFINDAHITRFRLMDNFKISPENQDIIEDVLSTELHIKIHELNTQNLIELLKLVAEFIDFYDDKLDRNELLKCFINNMHLFEESEMIDVKKRIETATKIGKIWESLSLMDDNATWIKKINDIYTATTPTISDFNFTEMTYD